MHGQWGVRGDRHGGAAAVGEGDEGGRVGRERRDGAGDAGESGGSGKGGGAAAGAAGAGAGALGRDGRVDAPAALLGRVEEGDDVLDGEEGQGLGCAGGGLDCGRGERGAAVGGEGDGVDAEVVGGAEDGAKVARVDDAIEEEDERVAPLVAGVGDAVVGAVDGGVLAGLVGQVYEEVIFCARGGAQAVDGMLDVLVMTWTSEYVLVLLGVE